MLQGVEALADRVGSLARQGGTLTSHAWPLAPGMQPSGWMSWHRQGWPQILFPPQPSSLCRAYRVDVAATLSGLMMSLDMDVEYNWLMCLGAMDEPPLVMSRRWHLQETYLPYPHWWAASRTVRTGSGPGCRVRLRAWSALGPDMGNMRYPSTESSWPAAPGMGSSSLPVLQNSCWALQGSMGPGFSQDCGGRAWFWGHCYGPGHGYFVPSQIWPSSCTAGQTTSDRASFCICWAMSSNMWVLALVAWANCHSTLILAPQPYGKEVGGLCICPVRPLSLGVSGCGAQYGGSKSKLGRWQWV